MQLRDWKTITLFGYIFGGLLLVLGIYMYLYYYETDWMDRLGSAFTPYQNYAILLIITGVALLITAYIAEKRATRKIGSFGYIFGLFLLALGIYVCVYYKTSWIGWIILAFYPYRNYAIPMLIVGIALLIIGYVANRFKNRYEQFFPEAPVGKLEYLANCFSIGVFFKKCV